MLYLIIRSLAIVLYKVLFHLQVSGLSNIPLTGGFILASNHLSYLDPPALAAACPRRLSFLAKEGLFKNALFGGFIAALNSFPVSSQSGELKSLRRAIRELQAGKGLTIFPEGERSVDGKLGEPMKGVGFLAVKAAVPIVPVFIDGSGKALPMHSKFIRLKKIKVYFGRPILPQELPQQLKGSNSYQMIAEMTMKEISRLKESSD